MVLGPVNFNNVWTSLYIDINAFTSCILCSIVLVGGVNVCTSCILCSIVLVGAVNVCGVNVFISCILCSIVLVGGLMYVPHVFYAVQYWWVGLMQLPHVFYAVQYWWVGFCCQWWPDFHSRHQCCHSDPHGINRR